jgi:hypothetical protein
MAKSKLKPPADINEKEFVSIPDVPAQTEEKPEVVVPIVDEETEPESITVEIEQEGNQLYSFKNGELKTVEEKPEEQKAESDEVFFLRRILYIQHSGGFGRHLDEIIYERIKSLA